MKMKKITLMALVAMLTACSLADPAVESHLVRYEAAVATFLAEELRIEVATRMGEDTGQDRVDLSNYYVGEVKPQRRWFAGRDMTPRQELRLYDCDTKTRHHF